MLSGSKNEISRLVYNNKALLDVLPDMILIIKDDFVIEYMNSAAVSKLGDKHGLKCHQVIYETESACANATCPFHSQDASQHYGQMHEKKLIINFT